MKVFVIFALIAVAASAPADEWSNFKKTYNKVYRSYEEEQFRKSVFAETLAFINEHNAKYEQGLYTFDTAINERADWTQEEWNSILTAKVPERSQEEPVVFASAPDRHDYRDYNMVTHVKDQKRCGSCWAFAVTGAVEGAWSKSTGTLLDLAEQELVDCGDGSCDGGWTSRAYQTIIAQGGQMVQSDYHYTAQDGWCQYDSNAYPQAQISSYRDGPSMSASRMADTIYATGPNAVLIYASSQSFQNYHSGVYYDPNCSQSTINHAVLAVGYDRTGSEPYWIVKNSWGSGWGDHGYIKMRYNVNQCNVERYPDYPVV